jgi:hypothetical protein
MKSKRFAPEAAVIFVEWGAVLFKKTIYHFILNQVW